MAYPLEIKEKAKRLRKKGYSLKEISEKLSIAKSTASFWLCDMELPNSALKKLKEKKILGQYKAVLTNRKKREAHRALLESKAQKILDGFTLDKEIAKLLCALIYYCEGVKNTSSVGFVNSDPTLISLFLFLFRKAFVVDESKFRVLMHLHDYHDEKKQINFWSKVAKVPKSQFSKTYWKPNTKKRKRDGYPGCIALRYYDAMLAKQLFAFYRVFSRIVVK